MKLISVAFLTLYATFSLFAQKLEIETTHEFESMTKDSYLGDVSYDPVTQITSLVYVEKNSFNTLFKTYTFDKDLKFLKEDIKTYTFGDQWKDAMKEIGDSFKWFKYSGESYTREWIDVRQGMGGKIIAIKQKATFNYSWFTGGYIPHYEPSETVKIKSETDDKIYLYEHVVNTETGDAYLIVGKKAPKGSKDKYQHARHFQIVKVTKDLEVEYMEEINFDHNMGISFKEIVYEEGYQPDEEYAIADLFHGELYLVFSPIKSPLGKSFVNPNAGECKVMLIDDAGKIVGQLDYNAPTTGWVIENMIKSPNPGEYYFYGPAKDEVYVNKVAGINSPLTMRAETKDIKYKNFQIMKIADKKIQWINSTPIEDFKSKASAPPSQKKLPEYKGKKFDKRVAFVTPAGELIICGQNYDVSSKQEPIPNTYPVKYKTVVTYKYKDLIMAHFDNEGALKRAYGVRRDKMNKWSKAIVTPMDLYLTPDGKSLYWVYGEIKGMKQGFAFDFLGGAGTVSKSKLLYYPAVAKVDLEKATIGDFKSLGADVEGKQIYFTNPNIGQIMSSDGKKLIFIGENKKGSLVWLAKMGIEQ